MAIRKATWKSRIVGHGAEDPEQLLAHPENYKIHTRIQQDALSDVLDEIGWVQEVIVNRTTGFVLDGHMRITLALRQGEPEVPVTYVELTEAEERLVLATLDPVGALAITDRKKARELVESIEIESQRLKDAIAAGMDLDLAGAVAEKRTDEQGDLKLSPEMHERHDYVVIYADNELDWTVLKSLLQIETVACPPVGKKTLQHKGLGRVVRAKDFLAMVETWRTS